MVELDSILLKKTEKERDVYKESTVRLKKKDRPKEAKRRLN